MSDDIAHLKNSIKILLAQNLELANRVLELEKCHKNLEYEIGRVRRLTNTPPPSYYDPC